jgi:BirA family biotin operon repressor/biotin-[acetyl-CoA-carboxylase] ligase
MQGRGRHRGRQWQGGVGNLFATIVIKQPDGLLPTFLSLLVAYALYRSVRFYVEPSVPLSLKWPNDIFIDKKKLGGILIETGPQETFLLGIGLNIAIAPSLPAPSRSTTCLQDWCPSPITTEEYLPTLLAALEEMFTAWKNQKAPVILSMWQQASQDWGRPISLKVGGKMIQGVFEGLEAQGHLVLRLPEGERKVIASGEVQ